MNCSSCHGCAYKSGAAANLEPHNHIRGVLAALGGFPFYCHESLGWKDGRDGYPNGNETGLVILSNRAKLAKATGMPIAKLSQQAEDVRQGLRVCGGWKSAVARLKELGWFANADVTAYRRYMAKHAAYDLANFTEDGLTEKQKQAYLSAIRGVMDWFLNESRESRVKLRWLLGDRF